MTCFSEAALNFGDFRQVCMGKTRNIKQKKNTRPLTFPLCCPEKVFWKCRICHFWRYNKSGSWLSIPNFNLYCPYRLLRWVYCFPNDQACKSFLLHQGAIQEISRYITNRSHNTEPAAIQFCCTVLASMGMAAHVAACARRWWWWSLDACRPATAKGRVAS